MKLRNLKSKKSKQKKKADSSAAASALAPPTQVIDEDDDDSEPETKSVKKVPVMTTFYKDLQTLQKRYYMYLRASIVLYMDDKARDYYITRIQQEDIRKDLPMASKYEPGQRIS